jgi:hypothetical protein
MNFPGVFFEFVEISQLIFCLGHRKNLGLCFLRCVLVFKTSMRLGTVWYGCGLKRHLPQNKKEVLAYSSSIFKFSVFMKSFTQAVAKTSAAIASEFVQPQDFFFWIFRH